jgi:site-specific recombinase XerC
MNKQERHQFDRLTRLLEAERQRAEQAWEGYRSTLYQLVDLQMKMERIQKAINGEE